MVKGQDLRVVAGVKPPNPQPIPILLKGVASGRGMDRLVTQSLTDSLYYGLLVTVSHLLVEHP